MVNCNLKFTIKIINWYKISKQTWIGAEQQICDEQAAAWNLADISGGSGRSGAGEGAEEQGGQIKEGLVRGTGGIEARVGGFIGHNQRTAGTQVNIEKIINNN